MHGLLTLSQHLVASSDNSSALRVALVTGIFLVLAAAVTAWGVTRQSKGNVAEVSTTQAHDLTANYVAELVERARRAEAAERAGEEKASLLMAEVGRLRELLRYWRKDPDADPDHLRGEATRHD